MKQVFFLRYALLYTALCINTLHAADETQYTVLPYDNTRDHQEALALIVNHFSKLVGPEKARTDRKKITTKYNAALHNNTHMCLLYQPIENSFTRLVLRNEKKLVGIADFYLIQEGYDALQKKDGYIETLTFENSDETHYSLLIHAALLQLRNLGAQRAMTHFRTDQLEAQSTYCSIIGSSYNTSKKEQTDFEKQKNVARVEVIL